MTVIYCRNINTKIGNLNIFSTNKGLCKIAFNNESKNVINNSDFQNIIIWNEDLQGKKSDINDNVESQLLSYFDKKLKAFIIPFDIKGTAFQMKVWRELVKIPYGQTTSYKKVAEAIGKPNAYRAVGNANNKNPIPIIIPCHRVISENGKITGYAGGIAKKKALLILEGACY